MFLSKSPAGVYYLYFRDEVGKRQAVSTRCRLKSDALKFLQTFQVADQERKVKLHRVLLSDFIPAFLAHSRTVHTVKTVDSNKTALDEFLRIVGDLPLHKVGIREIEAFLARKKDEASVWTARKYYLALAATFETARRWGHISTNPWRLVQKPKVPELLPTFFTRKEFVHLLEFIDDSDFRDLVLTAVSTGMRRGELIALKWESVDLVRGLLTVQAAYAKNGQTRTIPLNSRAREALVRLKAQSHSGYVFSKPNGLPYRSMEKPFQKACAEAGLAGTGVTLHTLRHTFASNLVMAGVDLKTVQEYGGWSDLTLVQRYSHLSASHKAKAIETIVERFHNGVHNSPVSGEVVHLAARQVSM